MYMICFADDQVVLAQDHDYLNYMARKLVEEYRKGGLEVNLKKTEKICIGGEQQHINVEDGRKIHCCEKYKYLGIKWNT